MGRNKFLLILGVFELLSLELARLFYVAKFVLESLLSLVVDVLDICYVLFSFRLGVIVNFERPVRPQERGVCSMMILRRYLFPVESISD